MPSRSLRCQDCDHKIHVSEEEYQELVRENLLDYYSCPDCLECIDDVIEMPLDRSE